MIALLAAAALIQQSSFNELVGSYVVCVRRNASRLEITGDSPIDVARGARSLCSQLSVDIANFQIQHPAPENQIGGGIEGTGEYVGASQAEISRYCRKAPAACGSDRYGLPIPK